MKRKLDIKQEISDSAYKKSHLLQDFRFSYRNRTEKYYELKNVRDGLPISKYRKEILETCRENQVIVLVGETGSGKTTQAPQFLMHLAKDKMVCCTQPRRVAAMSAGRRVAQEADVVVGEEVGYTIRFEDRTTRNTKLVYMTDGMLLRESMHDPFLSRFSIIMLDEAHERTNATDILFGIVKDLLRKRHDLKVMIMSATLAVEKFRDYFNKCPVIKVEGRTYPVEIFYVPEAEKDYFEAAIRTVLQIHKEEPEGDILLFLTGEFEIENACKRIKKECEQMISEESGNIPEIYTLPLYSTLPQPLQERVFEKAPHPTIPGKYVRKCIVATNIAETSLTIDGIVYVVDPGFVKQKVYDPRIRVESLCITATSQSAAKQRAGRAGRTKPGKCFRLYTEASFQHDLRPQTYPEILRSNLSSVILTMLKIGITDLVHFDFLDPPAPETIIRALELLNYVSALDDDGRFTKMGNILSEFPLDPQLSATLVNSQKYNCTHEVASLVSLLSVPPIFSRPHEKRREAEMAHEEFFHEDGDHLSLINVFNAFITNKKDRGWCEKRFLSYRSLSAAERIREQIVGIMIKNNIPLNSTPVTSDSYYINIRKALIEGFFSHVAYFSKTGRYITVKDEQQVLIHPSSCIADRKLRWIAFNEFVVLGDNKKYVRTVSSIKGEWLLEIAPKYYNFENFPRGEMLDNLKAIAYHKLGRRG